MKFSYGICKNMVHAEKTKFRCWSKNMQNVKALKIEVIKCLFINDRGQILIGQRPENKKFPLYWEIPGGKIEKGETVLLACVREMDEEFGVSVNVIECRPVIYHLDYDGDERASWLFYPIVCEDQVLQIHNEHRELKYIDRSQISDNIFVPADIQILIETFNYIEFIS